MRRRDLRIAADRRLDAERRRRRLAVGQRQVAAAAPRAPRSHAPAPSPRPASCRPPSGRGVLVEPVHDAGPRQRRACGWRASRPLSSVPDQLPAAGCTTSPPACRSPAGASSSYTTASRHRLRRGRPGFPRSAAVRSRPLAGPHACATRCPRPAVDADLAALDQLLQVAARELAARAPTSTLSSRSPCSAVGDVGASRAFRRGRRSASSPTDVEPRRVDLIIRALFPDDAPECPHSHAWLTVSAMLARPRCGARRLRLDRRGRDRQLDAGAALRRSQGRSRRPAPTRRRSSSTSGSKAAPPARAGAAGAARARLLLWTERRAGAGAGDARPLHQAAPDQPGARLRALPEGPGQLQRQPRHASASWRARTCPSATSRRRATPSSRSSSWSSASRSRATPPTRGCA